MSSSFGETLLGVGLSVLGAAFSSLANVLIKMSSDANKALPESQQVSPYKRPMWWFIFFLFVLNGVSDFAAFAFASLSVLAPISAVTIVINALLARWLLKEQLSNSGIVGSIIILGGSVLAVFSGSRVHDTNDVDELIALFERTPFVIFAIVKTVLCVVCIIALYFTQPELDAEAMEARNETLIFSSAPLAGGVVAGNDDDKVGDSDKKDGDVAEAEQLVPPVDVDAVKVAVDDNGDTPEEAARRPIYKPQASRLVTFRAVCYGMLTASVGAWTNQLGKGAVELMSVSAEEGEENQMDKAFTWILIVSTIVCALLQLVLMAKMMSSFEAVLIVPIFQCLFILHLIVAGMMYFEEFDDDYVNSDRIYLFMTSVALCCIGIVILSRGHFALEQKTAAAAAEAAAGAEAEAATKLVEAKDGDDAQAKQPVAAAANGVANGDADGDKQPVLSEGAVVNNETADV